MSPGQQWESMRHTPSARSLSAAAAANKKKDRQENGNSREHATWRMLGTQVECGVDGSSGACESARATDRHRKGHRRVAVVSTRSLRRRGACGRGAGRTGSTNHKAVRRSALHDSRGQVVRCTCSPPRSFQRHARRKRHTSAELHATPQLTSQRPRPSSTVATCPLLILPQRSLHASWHRISLPGTRPPL